jgi:hypothetical protein
MRSRHAIPMAGCRKIDDPATNGNHYSEQQNGIWEEPAFLREQYLTPISAHHSP